MSGFVVTYDISLSSSREHVADMLLVYGRRVQRSVFEIEIDHRQLESLLAEIGPWLGASDALDVFPMDARRPEHRVSWFKPPYPEKTVFIVGKEEVVR